MDHEAFKAFLKGEMNRRNISVTEFAKLVGVSHSTILRFVSDKPSKVYFPTLEFLEKIAVATGVSLNIILATCFPETARKLEIEPDIAIINDILLRLPADKRQTVLHFLRSFEGS